jgi:uroporphyrinogen-III synthase
MQIHLFEGRPLSLEGVQAILATSANGVRALARRTSERDVAVFTVGPQTLEAAREAGFMTVDQAGGNASALAQVVQASLRPDHGVLLVATGRERPDEIEIKLATAGFTLRVEELYEASDIPQLSPEAARALANDEVDAVMLFSPRSARLFASQIQSAKLERNCACVLALCISEAAAAALSLLHFAGCRIAARPDRDAMLQLLDEAAQAAPPRSL